MCLKRVLLNGCMFCSNCECNKQQIIYFDDEFSTMCGVNGIVCKVVLRYALCLSNYSGFDPSGLKVH